ncbi:terminase small subunit [Bacillus cereus]|uniref:terminase small subunit n=1 Tax=Bacillus cereus group TaxID=86661 RepID=UPI0002795DEE|nr:MULTISPECIES: terminase small subunit [Bacillus cereus group]EJQ77740.1 hypothetical protein IGO_05718 [Bacillus toyonensis]MCC2397557.1 terminase small subunit [Bacillus cereus]
MIIRWKYIRHLWESEGYTYNDIHKEFGINLSTIKSRSKRDGWNREEPLPYGDEERALEDKEIAIKEERNRKKKQADRDRAVKEAQALAKKSPMKINHNKDLPVSVTYTREDGEQEEMPLLEYLYDEDDGLTDGQRLFCYHYLTCFNATKAYQRAYNCSYATARTQGSILLKETNVYYKLMQLRKANAQALQIDAQTVLQKYVDIAFADITSYVEFGKQVKKIKHASANEGEEGATEEYYVNYVDLKNSSEVDGTLITEIRQGRDGVTFKLADKMKALEFLTKYTDVLNNNSKKQLEEEKLKVEIEAKKTELAGGNEDNNAVVFVTNEDEMLRVIEERKQNKEQEHTEDEE